MESQSTTSGLAEKTAAVGPPPAEAASAPLAAGLKQDFRRLLNTGVFHVLVMLVGAQGLAFIQQIAVTRLLDPATMGQVFYIMRVIVLVSMVADLGLRSGVLKFASEPVSDERKRQIYRTGMLYGTLISSLLGALYVGCLLAAHLLGYKIDLLPELALMALYLPATAIGQIPPVFLQARKEIKKSSNLSLVSSIVRLAAVVAGAALWGLWGYLYGLLLGCLLQFALFLGATASSLQGVRSSFEILRKLLNFGFFSLLANFSSFANASLGIFLLRWMGKGDQDVAILGTASLVMLAASLLPASLLQTAFPYLSGLKEQPQRLLQRVAELSRKQTLVVLALTAALAAVGYWAFPLVFGKAYQASYLPCVLLMGGLVGWSVGAPYGQAMFALDRVRTNFLVSVVQLLVTGFLSLLLIPMWSAAGAAAAFGVGSWVSGLGNVLSCRLALRNRAKPALH